MSRDFARDQALETLMLALEQESALTPSSGRVGFLRARPHDRLREFGDRLVCVQDFKPQAEALEQAGFTNADALEGSFRLVLLLPNRQREETLGDFASAFDKLEDGGVLLVSMHNDWGARRYEKLLGDFAGEVGSVSKHHCRAFWARKSSALDPATWSEWRSHGECRRVIDERFWSRPGLFSWNEIDEGSQLLIDHLPQSISGRVADLGASWGVLSDFILRRHPNLLSLDCFEADRGAVECLRRNLESITTRHRPKIHWADVTQGAGVERFDFIVMNPPFHEGRNPDHLLGAKFIAMAAQALKPGGRLWMVANRHLPYEHLLEEAFQENERLVQTAGFKVFAATRALASSCNLPHPAPR